MRRSSDMEAGMVSTSLQGKAEPGNQWRQK
jgi:hypothetical protein